MLWEWNLSVRRGLTGALGRRKSHNLALKPEHEDSGSEPGWSQSHPDRAAPSPRLLRDSMRRRRQSPQAGGTRTGDFSVKSLCFCHSIQLLKFSEGKSDKSKVKEEKLDLSVNSQISHRWPKYCFVFALFLSLSLLSLQEFNLEETP